MGSRLVIVTPNTSSFPPLIFSASFYPSARIRASNESESEFLNRRLTCNWIHCGRKEIFKERGLKSDGMQYSQADASIKHRKFNRKNTDKFKVCFDQIFPRNRTADCTSI